MFVLVNILVVEDDVKLNQIVCAHLTKNGYSATGCFTADEAYNVMYNSLYDMIISEKTFPDPCMISKKRRLYR